MDSEWFRKADPTDENAKIVQSEICLGIVDSTNFNTKKNRFQRSETFQDKCVKKFPKVNLLEPGKLEKAHLAEVGILVCRIGWDSDN